MLAKTLKIIVTMLKNVCAWPPQEPAILYDRGTFVGFNLRDIHLRYVGEPTDFTVALPLKALTKAASLCKPMDEVEIVVDDDGRPSLVRGSTTYKLGDPPLVEDFPDPFVVENLDVVGHFDSWPLKALMPMVSKDEGRPHLHCLRLEADPTLGLKMVATDGHRLVHRMIPTKETLEPGVFLVPGGALPLLTKLAPSLSFAWGDQGAVFLDGPWQLYLKEQDGHFPPYEKIIPRGPWEWTVTVDRGETLAACKSVKIGIDGVTLAMDPTSAPLETAVTSTLILECHDPDGFEATSTLTATIEGEFPSRLGLNLTYLMDALHATEHDVVTLRGHGPTDSVDIGGDNVVMPMRLEPVERGSDA